MSESDSVIGAVLFAIEMLMRQAKWDIEPQGKSKADKEAAEFVKSCMDDMQDSWQDTLSEIMSFIIYGWSYHEICYKRRQGKNDNSDLNSKYNDNLIGWKKLPIRAQDTLYRWEYDNNDELIGMAQAPPPNMEPLTIPKSKAILFRTKSKKNNPEGRALAIDTPMLTPDGWRTMGDLQEGDRVFDEQGKIRYVVATKKWFNRPCYKLKFSDGSEIVADENHEWLTFTAKERHQNKQGKVRTTLEINQSVKVGNEISNHAIRLAKPLEYVEQGLVLDPYYLGQWLGDGTSRTADITTHVDDAEETIDLIYQSTGVKGVIYQNGKRESKGRRVSYGRELREKLRSIGVFMNKHIPEYYLRGNVEQRLALLQGLMDSDGTVDSFHRCTFTNTNKNLADGVYELVSSLGCVPKMSIKMPDKHRKQIAYNVKFTPLDFIPFRLKRKVARVTQERARNWHYIVSCEKVDNQTTKCIEVDSPSHLYLAGKSLVPTHNSVLRSCYRDWFFKKRMQEFEGIGVERGLAGLPMLTPPEGVDIWDTSDPNMVQVRMYADNLVKNARLDALMGIVKPFGWTFELLSGSSRNLNISPIIERYDSRIAMTVLADFVLLGHQQVGSFALSSDKTRLFAVALGAFMDIICEAFNTQAIPQLIELNKEHFKGLEHIPKMIHGDVETPNLGQISAFLKDMVGASILTPDENMESYVRRVANLPEAVISEQAPAIDTRSDGQNKPNKDGKGKDDTNIGQSKASAETAKIDDIIKAVVQEWVDGC